MDRVYIVVLKLNSTLLADDCVKTNKERREETDAITLEMLVEMIKESMMVFHEFVVADKKATNGGLTKVDVQECGSSELLSEVVSSLQKVCFLHHVCH